MIKLLVACDAKALEWLVATWLSKDETASNEIINNVDQHTDNQQRFGLPSRLIAKTFVFRLIYGGSAYSYANDPDFMEVSPNEKFWQKVIDEFYSKYKGLGKWHETLMQTVTTTGELQMPTGRIFKYHPTERRGDVVWPRTTVLNYPVQGSGADLMCLARVSFARRFKANGIRGVLISTVHDSIVVDVEDDEVDRVCHLFHEVFNDIPKNFERIFGVPFELPARCEVEYGPTLKNTQVWVDTTQ